MALRDLPREERIKHISTSISQKHRAEDSQNNGFDTTTLLLGPITPKQREEALSADSRARQLMLDKVEASKNNEQNQKSDNGFLSYYDTIDKSQYALSASELRDAYGIDPHSKVAGLLEKAYVAKKYGEMMKDEIQKTGYGIVPQKTEEQMAMERYKEYADKAGDSKLNPDAFFRLEAQYGDSNVGNTVPYLSKTDEKWNPYVNATEGQRYTSANEYMTPEEIDNYFALLQEDVLSNKYTGNAERYKDSLPLYDRMIQKKIDDRKDDSYISKIGTAAFAGLNDFASGIIDFGNMMSGRNPSKLLSMHDADFIAARESIGNGEGKAFFDLTRSIVRNTASQVFGLGSGGAANIVISIVSGAGSAGSAYRQSLQEGHTKEEAMKYGIVSGLAETLTEYVSGAGRLFGGSGDGVIDAMKKTVYKNSWRPAAKFVATFGLDAIGEAGEEYLQALGEKVFRNIAYGENNKYEWSDLVSEEALYNALLGAISGGMMGSVSSSVNILANKGQYNYSQNVIDTAKAAGFTDTDTVNKVANWAESTKTPVVFMADAFIDPVSGTQVDAIEADGMVFLSAQAKNPMLELVVHETAHTAQNTPQYQALLAEVKQSGMFASAGSWENAVARYQQYYAQEYNIKYSFEQAQAEMVAKYIGENLYKSPESQKFVRQYMSGGLQRMLANRSYRQQYRAADAQGQQILRQERALAEALRNRQNLTPEQIYATQQRIAEGDLTGSNYALVGLTPNGIEIYETSKEIKALPYSERKKILVSHIKNEYRGRTAKFEKNGKIYYATLDDVGTRKGAYGDKKSDRRGFNAKINVGADGNYFELVENSRYDKSSKEKGKKTNSNIHEGTKSWDYYQKTVIVDGRVYDVLVNVADKGDNQYVYDVKLTEKKGSGLLSRSNEASFGQRKTTTNTNIPQSEADVNTKYMQNGINYSAGNSRLADILSGARDVDAEYQQTIDTYGEMNVDRPVATPKRVDDSGQKVSQAASTFLNNAETQQEVKMVKAGIVDAQYNYDPIKIEAAKAKARARIEGDDGIGYDAAKKEVASRAADTDADAILNISPADYVYYGELYDMAVAQGDYDTAQNCLLVMFEAASVSGKILAIQRNRMRNLLSGISKSRAIQRDISRINNGFSAKYIEKYGRIEIPAEMYETLEKAVTPEEIEAAEAAIYDKAAEQWKATAWEKWRNYRYLAMLGNLKTWNKNTASNWANFGLSHSDNLMSVAWQKLWGKFDFEKASTILWNKSELGKQIQPDVHARSLEMAEAEASHKYQDSPQSEIESRRKKFGDSKVGRLLEKASEATDKIMQTGVIETVTKGKRGKKISGGDKAMFARAWEFYAGNYMVANNLTEITAEVENYATKAAQELVFHSDNGISKAVQNIRKSSKGAAAVIDFAMPFVKTPANVLQQGFQRSPAGLILNGTKLVKEMVKTHKNGGKVSAQTLNKFSRGVTGSMLFALGMLLANLGIASGKEDESAKGRSASELGGGQSLSLNVFGTSIAFDWLEPASYPFLVGVLFENGLEESDTSGAVFDALCAGYNEIFDMSMLAGLTEIFDSGSYGQDKNMIGDAAAKLLTNAATQSIPTVVGQLARTIDPVKRKTTSGDSVFTDVLGDNFLSDTASTIAARIPFASKLLEAERDVWGNEVGRSGDSALVNAINQFISPAAINGGSGYDDDLVTQIVMDLYEKTGDAKVIPTELDKNKAREELGSAYNSENYQEMRQDVGEAQHDAIYELVTSNTPIELYDNYVDANGKKRRRKYTKTFYEMTDEEKVKVISKTSTEAKSQAIEDYVEAFANILP